MFEHIIGHKAIQTFLTQSIKNERVAHAYLFLGPHHVGKMTIARLMASTLLGGTYTLEMHPDVTVVSRLTDEKTKQPKQTITIEQIRGLRDRLAHSSLLPSWKVAIVEDADTMTTEAANALLKTLEEPRGKTVIFLIGSDARRIPLTVCSRAQRVRFGQIAREELAAGLVAQGASKEKAEFLARIARGRPGVALTLLQNADELDTLESAAHERMMLLGKPTYERLRWIEARTKSKKQAPLYEELALWRELLRDELLCALDLSELSSFEKIKISDQDPSFKIQVSRLKRLMESEDASRHHVDPRLVLEHFLCI